MAYAIFHVTKTTRKKFAYHKRLLGLFGVEMSRSGDKSRQTCNATGVVAFRASD